MIDATRIEQYILNNCSDNEEINAIYAEIINAPTVDVEPVRGQWQRWRCSMIEVKKNVWINKDKIQAVYYDPLTDRTRVVLETEIVYVEGEPDGIYL